MLDVGCGLGQEALRFAAEQPGAQVIGLDREAMIAEASRRAASLGVDVRWMVGEAEELPLPDRSVDACLTERVLKYLPEPERGVREIARVLKPSGRFGGFELDYNATMLGGDQEVASLIGELLNDSVGEPRMGRRLPDLLASEGMLDVDCRPVIFITPWDIHNTVVMNTVRDAIDRGDLPEQQALDWIEELSAGYESGRFTSAFAGCRVTARMPA